MDKPNLFYIYSISLILFLLACEKNMTYSLSDSGLQEFIVNYEKVVEPLMTHRNQAEWDAYTTGKEVFFEATTKYSLQIDSVHQRNEHFLYLKKLQMKKSSLNLCLNVNLTFYILITWRDRLVLT